MTEIDKDKLAEGRTIFQAIGSYGSVACRSHLGTEVADAVMAERLRQDARTIGMPPNEERIREQVARERGKWEESGRTV